MSTGSDLDQPPNRPRLSLGAALHACGDWLVSGPNPQPADISKQLILQSLTKTRTLVIAITASSLTAFAAVAMTGAVWAYTWLLAELAVGATRLYFMNALIKAEASGRNGNTVAPIFAGLAAFVVLSCGCFQCVVSGEWALISMAGIGLASLSGAVSSRNAGTPRYGAILICILVVPYALATVFSPIPHLFIVGVQLPFYACGVIFVMLENYRMLLNLYHSERENREMAQHDLLTGLPNRAQNLVHFDRLLKGLRSGHSKIRQEFMVFCLDLDGFKDVNDRFGHAAGDTVLVAVADRLRDSIRAPDFVSRVGGDEFVILLPGISDAGAGMIADRIIASIAVPFDLGLPAPVNIGVSIGSARAPDDGETADQLLRSADRALYEAKRRGKGKFVSHGALSVTLAPAADADAGMDGLNGLQKGSRALPCHFGQNPYNAAIRGSRPGAERTVPAISPDRRS